VAEIHERLALPEVLRDGAAVKQLSSELTEIEQRLPSLYEHWEEAVELNG
jgi:hypothetical protein